MISNIYPAYLYPKICGFITQQVQLLKKAVVVSLDFSEKNKLNSLCAEAGESEP